MAYQLGQQIEMLSKYSNVDLLYGPYQNKKAACDNIPKATRDFGRTVLILENGEYKEYWWKDGIEDNNLVLKLSATAGDVQLVQGKNTTGIVKNGSDVEESKGYTPTPIIEGIPYFKDIIRLDETSAINTLADDDLGFDLNIIPNIEFIWVGQFQYWDDGVFHTLVPNAVYIKYFNDITQNYAYEVKQYLGNPIIPSINQKYLIPEHLRFIGMTVIINDTKEEYWFKDGVKDENLVKKAYNANDGILTLTVGNNTKTFSANQSTNEEFEIKASDLGLFDVMRFIGTAVKTQPTSGEYKIFNTSDGTYYYVRITYDGIAKEIPAKIGDVFIYDNKEFACIAVADAMPGEIVELGDAITYPLASKNTAGLVKAGEEISDTNGYTPVSFKNGVPYFKQTAIADTGLYVNVLRENPGTQYYDSGGDVQTVNLTKFKENDIILVPDSFNTILYCYTKSGALYSILYPNRLYKIVKHYESDKDGNIVYFAKPFGIEYQKPSVHECKIIKNNDKGEPSYNHHIGIDLAHEVNLVNIKERCKLRFLLDDAVLKPNNDDGVISGRILYKKFKIIVTNDSDEDKYIYFDANDENPLNTGISITHKSNVNDRTFTITKNSINILYITIVGLNSLSDSYGEINYFVDYYGNT